MPARSKHGSNRIVAYVSDENYLAMAAELTSPGETKPSFGVISKFVNGLIDDWRARKALATKETKQ